jgi:hypothetical protein
MFLCLVMLSIIVPCVVLYRCRYAGCGCAEHIVMLSVIVWNVILLRAFMSDFILCLQIVTLLSVIMLNVIMLSVF